MDVPSGAMLMSSSANDTSLVAAGFSLAGTGRAEGYNSSLPAVPNAHSHTVGAGVIGTKAYFVGGYNGAVTCQPFLDEFDVTTQKWTPRQQMNIPRYGHLVTSFNGKVYAMGGYCTAGSVANEIYDPASNSWSLGAALPGSNHLAGAGGVLSDNKIHLVAGYNNVSANAPTPVHDVYDPATNSWTTAAPYPLSVFWPASGVLPDGRLIVAGGHNGSAPVSDTHIYDPANNSWTKVASMPLALYVHAGTVVGGKFHTFMGHTVTAQSNYHYIYDPSSDTWTSGTAVPFTAYAPPVAQLKGGALIVSGWNGPNITNVAEYLGGLYLYSK